MRFITIALIALMPVTALAGDTVTPLDISEVYEYVDASMMAGNSCSATGKDGSNCSIPCPDHERALCSGSDEAYAFCECAPGSKPPRIQDFR